MQYRDEDSRPWHDGRHPASIIRAPRCLTRRAFLGALGGSALAALAGPFLSGCSRSEPLLRIASNIFPGYELLHLAAAQNLFNPEAIRMLTLPSATACMQALAAGNVEGAALTLDEVLSARADNLMLKVIALLDISLGADVLLAKPHITTLAALKGKRIGVEQSAVGAVMLDAALSQAGLSSQDVTLVHATVDHHLTLYAEDKVDALVTFEPVPTQLQGQGAVKLFDSSQVPGRIVDVLAVRPEVLEESPQALQQVVAGHFSALAQVHAQVRPAMAIIGERLGIPPEAVPASFNGLELPDAKANLAWLGGPAPRIMQSAQELNRVMLKSGLLRHTAPLDNLADDRFLPAP